MESSTCNTFHNICLHLHPSKKSITAVLKTPKEEECPILREPISSASFDFLPRPFNVDHPEHTAITLCQCSHTFHAMALVYHWARNNSVLCPVCRSGPKGQRLSIRKLPREWRYSLAARIRRQKQIDRNEAEEDDRRVAMELMSSEHNNLSTIIIPVASMFINIRIEVMSTVNVNDLETPVPLSWIVNTVPMRVSDAIVFDVPSRELCQIPYSIGTRMRLVPQTNAALQPLRPSRWFVAGVDQHIDANFNAHCTENGFHHLHYSMSDAAYDEMALDIFMAHDILIAVN